MFAAASIQAVASTSGAITNRPDIELAEDARTGSPTPAVWTHSSIRDLAAQTVTAPPTPAPAPERAPSANPLWGIPLTSLSGTRDRPIFSPSRRPPAPAVAPAAAKVAVAKPRERERPQLNLVGTIASGDEAFGIFLDSSTKAALRLKIGEDYQGWKLRSVQGREVVLEKDQEVITLELPRPGGEQAVSEVRSEARASTSTGKLATSPPRLDKLSR